ncbi:hypothetical protein D3C73_104080 [compost metagenome]
MESNNFYKPEDIDYEKIVPVYQEAFRGWPWYEQAKCADMSKVQRCQGGLSRLALGQTCGVCLNAVSLPAYEPAELIDRFTDIAATRPTRWYQEDIDQQTAVAALAWPTDAARLAQEKYADVDVMGEWMQRQLGRDEFVWLDEIFADKRVRESGNLQNFKAIAEGFMDAFERNTMAFRTINPALVRAAERDFDPSVTVSRQRLSQVPDRRDFVIIKREEM